MLTDEQLRQIMPHCPDPVVRADGLAAAMLEFEIDMVTRGAAWLAQLAHESSELRLLLESADGLAYEGRTDLGNIQKGDGPRFKGRGYMQHTGRKNYDLLGRALGLDLLLYPELLEQPLVAARAAGWFWTVGAGLNLSKAARERVGYGCNLNNVSDRLDFEATCLAINGGWNGLAQRMTYYHRGLEVLGAKAALVG